MDIYVDIKEIRGTLHTFVLPWCIVIYSIMQIV